MDIDEHDWDVCLVFEAYVSWIIDLDFLGDIMVSTVLRPLYNCPIETCTSWHLD